MLVGTHHLKKSIQKLSISIKKCWQNPQYAQNMSLVHIGRIDERKGKTLEEIFGKEKAERLKKNQSLSLIGRKQTKESNLKRSIHRKQFLKQHPEEIQRMRERNCGKNLTEETKQKRRLARSKYVPRFWNTSIEIALQNILRDNNIVFEKHKPIYGQPDLFIEPNICVFADGDYWHCNPKFYKSDYFHKGYKFIAEEIWKKDKYVTDVLTNMGHKVLRFWEYDINNNIANCFAKIRGLLCL
jgi:G:T-mismatch repair DNA endonuclease (very short patch repair protein)